MAEKYNRICITVNAKAQVSTTADESGTFSDTDFMKLVQDGCRIRRLIRTLGVQEIESETGDGCTTIIANCKSSEYTTLEDKINDLIDKNNESRLHFRFVIGNLDVN